LQDPNEVNKDNLSNVRWEVAIRKLKMYKSLGSDQIRAELIQAGGIAFCDT
jgi:hypothetical protein